MVVADLVPRRAVTPLAALGRFACVGAVLFAVLRLSGLGEAHPARSVTVTVAADADAARVRQAADEAILVAVGLQAGWPQTDPVIRQRLVRNLRFARPETAADVPAQALVDEAIALGMARTDPVVRRRLIDRAWQAVDGPGIPEPTQDELRAFMASRAHVYAASARLEVTHVFVSRDRHGEAAEARAHSLRAHLSAAGAPTALVHSGDPWPKAGDAARQILTTERLRSDIGIAVGQALSVAPVGRWTPPLSSPYGLHLFYVWSRRPRALPPLDALRHRVRTDWRDEQRGVRRAAHLQALRAAWTVDLVRVAPVAP